MRFQAFFGTCVLCVVGLASGCADDEPGQGGPPPPTIEGRYELQSSMAFSAELPSGSGAAVGIFNDIVSDGPVSWAVGLLTATGLPTFGLEGLAAAADAAILQAYPLYLQQIQQVLTRYEAALRNHEVESELTVSPPVDGVATAQHRFRSARSVCGDANAESVYPAAGEGAAVELSLRYDPATGAVAIDDHAFPYADFLEQCGDEIVVSATQGLHQSLASLLLAPLDCALLGDVLGLAGGIACTATKPVLTGLVDDALVGLTRDNFQIVGQGTLSEPGDLVRLTGAWSSGGATHSFQGSRMP